MPEVIKNWRLKAASLRSFEWVICVDGNRPETLETAQRLVAHYAHGSIKVVVQPDAPFNCVRGWNLGATHASGKVIIAVADDFDPPAHWDEKLLALEPKQWEDGEHVVHVNDGYVRTICTLSILTRKRYDRFGYLFYPQYCSMFCDTEFTEVAYRDGVVINAMHLLFEHMHPDCGKRARDAEDAQHASSDRWRHGEMLFNYRKYRGFPQDAGPNAVATEVSTRDRRTYAAYMQVNRNDFCLVEVCQRLIEEGVTTFFWAVPDAYWTGEPTTQANFDELSTAQTLVTAAGGNVRCKVFKVRNYAFSGDSRITVETRLRNDSLAWIRRNGYHDILIVDGDELWKRGLLSQVDALVQRGAAAVNTALVPVIGLPGYPVDRAQDTAVVYIGGNTQFSVCRTPEVQPTKIFEPMLFHFTGTRRTMEEVVAKHKASGHYDDPAYDFEGWLKHVLPNIRPGFTYTLPGGKAGLHMYTPYQIWPAIRRWTPEETADIPSSLHAFLGVSTPIERTLGPADDALAASAGGF